MSVTRTKSTNIENMLCGSAPLREIWLAKTQSRKEQKE
jgi:hypothetical protein